MIANIEPYLLKPVINVLISEKHPPANATINTFTYVGRPQYTSFSPPQLPSAPWTQYVACATKKTPGVSRNRILKTIIVAAFNGIANAT